MNEAHNMVIESNLTGHGKSPKAKPRRGQEAERGVVDLHSGHVTTGIPGSC